MNDLLVIVAFGLLMSGIALVGGLVVWLPEAVLERWLRPMVGFAAGSLIGGAFFRMLPHALNGLPAGEAMGWVVVGFAAFLALDQLLEWHHCHRSPSRHVRPLGPLLLVADALHNLLGGLAIGAIFTVDLQAGVSAWVAAALHEVPQEIGDFGAIVHSGYTRRQALGWNFLSALTFPLGGVIAWFVGQQVPVGFLVALGAGNFLYVASADLIPEIKRSDRLGEAATRFVSFSLGASLLFAASFVKG